MQPAKQRAAGQFETILTGRGDFPRQNKTRGKGAAGKILPVGRGEPRPAGDTCVRPLFL